MFMYVGQEAQKQKFMAHISYMQVFYIIIVVLFIVQIIAQDYLIESNIQDVQLNLLKFAQQEIDIEDVIAQKHYMDETNKHFRALYEQLKTISDTFGLTCIYIVQVSNKKVIYLVDSYDIGSQLHQKTGTVESSYSANIIQKFQSNTQFSIRTRYYNGWGFYKVSYYPLTDSKGNIVAWIGSDIDQGYIVKLKAMYFSIVTILALQQLIFQYLFNKELLSEIKNVAKEYKKQYNLNQYCKYSSKYYEIDQLTNIINDILDTAYTTESRYNALKFEYDTLMNRQKTALFHFENDLYEQMKSQILETIYIVKNHDKDIDNFVLTEQALQQSELNQKLNVLKKLIIFKQLD